MLQLLVAGTTNIFVYFVSCFFPKNPAISINKEGKHYGTFEKREVYINNTETITGKQTEAKPT